MMMPSIFGESLFDDDFDDWFDFRMPQFPDVDKVLYGRHAKNIMKTDVKENGDKYEVSVDLPGFDKDNVKVELKNGYLTISAEKGLDKEDKNEDRKYLRKERYEGSMSRSFYVGEETAEEDVKARFEDGVLKLAFPKEQPKKVEEPKYIAIEG